LAGITEEVEPEVLENLKLRNLRNLASGLCCSFGLTNAEARIKLV
jgi:hypothetical protein